jgi:hypothetical protein
MRAEEKTSKHQRIILSFKAKAHQIQYQKNKKKKTFFSL